MVEVAADVAEPPRTLIKKVEGAAAVVIEEVSEEAVVVAIEMTTSAMN